MSASVERAPQGEFAFTRLEKVVFGPGRLAELGPELARRGLKRAVVVTGRSLGASPLLTRVTAAMDGRCAGVFAGAAQHAPTQTVRALTAEADHRIDVQAQEFGGELAHGLGRSVLGGAGEDARAAPVHGRGHPG